ncbi:MAG: histone [Candidatus Aenigmatarchaeota archaeon]
MRNVSQSRTRCLQQLRGEGPRGEVGPGVTDSSAAKTIIYAACNRNQVNMVKEFPGSPLERVMRKAGAERVAASAVDEMRNVMLDMAGRIASDAIAACRHAKRSTVKREDVALATRGVRTGRK